MNAAINKIKSRNEQEVCNIVVLYDGEQTRSRAMSACDYLCKEFWSDVELKLHWWRTDFLCDPVLAKVAADDAVAADFLILSPERGDKLSPAMESWFESWLDRRGEVVGALVDLSSVEHPTPREFFLREAGRRGKFDYLKADPDGGGKAHLADGRSGKMSGHIKDIPDEPPSSHYGLNE